MFLDIIVNNKDIIAKYVDVKNLSSAAICEFNLSVKISSKKPIVVPGSSKNASASAGIVDIESEDDEHDDEEDNDDDEDGSD